MKPNYLDMRGFQTQTDDSGTTYRIRGSGVGPGYVVSQLFLGAVLGFIFDLVVASQVGPGVLVGALLALLVTVVIAALRVQHFEFKVGKEFVDVGSLRLPVTALSEILLYNKFLGGEIASAQRKGAGFFIVGTGMGGISLLVASALSNAASALGADMRRLRLRSLAKRANQLCLRHGAELVPLARHLTEKKAISLFDAVMKEFEVSPAQEVGTADATSGHGASARVPQQGMAQRLPNYQAIDALRLKWILVLMAAGLLDSVFGLLAPLFHAGNPVFGPLVASTTLIYPILVLAWMGLAFLLWRHLRVKSWLVTTLLWAAIIFKASELPSFLGVWHLAGSAIAIAAFWASQACLSRHAGAVTSFSYIALAVGCALYFADRLGLVLGDDYQGLFLAPAMAAKMSMGLYLLQIWCLYQLYLEVLGDSKSSA